MFRKTSTLDKFFSKIGKGSQSIVETSSQNNLNSNDIENGNVSSKRVREDDVELLEEEIVYDPGLRRQIEDFSFHLRDQLRRKYLDIGPCRPHGHVFPSTKYSNDERSFQEKWFQKFDWLEYSVIKNAAFCLWCYLFGQDHKYGKDAFTKDGYSNWKHALDKFQAHERSASHNYSKSKVFGYKDQRHNIDYVMNQVSGQKEVEYRKRLTAVVDVIRYLLGQGLAFRGHDESTESVHRGNFLELIKWYCDHDEEVSKVMNSNAPSNNMLTSPRIQKDIINACAIEVKNFILTEIGGKCFSLLIDESRDSSVKEQMSIVLRFVNDQGEVIERFLGVVHVHDTSAQSLKKSIDSFFAKSDLSLSRLRGQGYDGASNMRGEFNGLKALVLKENEQAHYIHCFAHRLQLVVVATAKKNGFVASFFEYLSMIVTTVGASCKRRDELRQKQYDDFKNRIESGELYTGKGMNQEMSLARAGDTRWGSHYNTITRLFDLWNPVQEVLQAIFEDCTESKSQGLALGLVDKMENFEFVFIGQLMKQILGMTNTLSQVLQQKNQNIGLAMQLITVLKGELRDFRNDGWHELLDEVTKFCTEKRIFVPNMEDVIPGRGRKTIDGQRRTYSHLFCVDIFLQVCYFS